MNNTTTPRFRPGVRAVIAYDAVNDRIILAKRGARVIDERKFLAAYAEKSETARAIRRMRFWDTWAPRLAILALMGCTSLWVLIGYGICHWLGWM